LYKTRFIGYESYLISAKQEILDALSLTQPIEGNIVEFGSARCGTSALMGNLLKQNKILKKIYALDTFGSGFDKRELARERFRGLTDAKEEDFTFNSFAYVQAKIKALKLERYVVPIQGIFQQTFDSIEGKFSLAIVDCDLSESVKYSLESVWPRLTIGGIILVDEYWNSMYRGVKGAVDLFVKKKRGDCEAQKLQRLYRIRKI
jgi:O-methyltransferase